MIKIKKFQIKTLQKKREGRQHENVSKANKCLAASECSTAARFNLGYYTMRKHDTWENRETSFDLSSISCVGALTRGYDMFSPCGRVCLQLFQHAIKTLPLQPKNLFHILNQAQKQVLIFQRCILAFKPDFELEEAAAAIAPLRRQRCCVGQSWNPVSSVFRTIRCSNSGHRSYSSKYIFQLCSILLLKKSWQFRFTQLCEIKVSICEQNCYEFNKKNTTQSYWSKTFWIIANGVWECWRRCWHVLNHTRSH